MAVPATRIRGLAGAPVRPEAEYVLYWMTAQRRTRFNHALERAVEWCRELGKPLLVLEALRAGHPHASERVHRFVLDGMEDNARRLARTRVAYYPYVEPRPDDGKGLLAALAERASVVVADDSPAFFLPRMLEAAAGRLAVRLEAVDGVGLLPLRSTDRIFKVARSFRSHLGKHLAPHLRDAPKPDPLARLDIPALAGPPADVARRWPPGVAMPDGIDASVPPVPIRGGPDAAGRALRRFVTERLPRYEADRNRPEEEATSGLSPYLHFGHVSPHEVHARVTEAGGGEAFLDQLVTWRELGFHTAAKLDGYDEYDSLPGWAQQTLAEHAADPREHVYSVEELEVAATHDPLWNAAQRQLRREGVIHNYLRMLWGKKVLEWSASPREALAAMLWLNDRWAIDGRDPNSVSGIFWCLGRYDRAWGPERPVFGKVRYMSSANTARKVRVKGYLARYGKDAG